MSIDFTKMKTAEQKEREAAHAEQERINREARNYLTETDWYVLRFQETGVEIPEDVLSKREEARERVRNTYVSDGPLFTIEERK